MDIQELRSQIDAIDDELVRLFCKRMEVSSNIAAFKKEHAMPIYIPAREREKLQDVSKKAAPGMDNYTRVLYSMLFELSRSYQSKKNMESTPLHEKIVHHADSQYDGTPGQDDWARYRSAPDIPIFPADPAADRGFRHSELQDQPRGI